jgi:hypothetical protein
MHLPFLVGCTRVSDVSQSDLRNRRSHSGDRSDSLPPKEAQAMKLRVSQSSLRPMTNASITLRAPFPCSSAALWVRGIKSLRNISLPTLTKCVSGLTTARILSFSAIRSSNSLTPQTSNTNTLRPKYKTQPNGSRQCPLRNAVEKQYRWAMLLAPIDLNLLL